MNHPDNQEALDAALATDLPIFLKFTATWCGPCQMISPQLDELSIQYAGKIVFIGVDVDIFGEFSQKHNIEAMPTSFIIKGGEVVSEKVVGANINKIRAIIEQLGAWVA